MLSFLATPARIVPGAPKPYQLLFARKGTIYGIPRGLLHSASRFNSSGPGDNTKDFFLPPSAPHIKQVETAWVHPV